MVHALSLLFVFIAAVTGHVTREYEWAKQFHAQAMQLVQEGNYDLGLAHFRAACRWRNDSALYWNDLGVTEMRTGLYTLAKKRFLKALSIDPVFELARLNIEELHDYSVEEPDRQARSHTPTSQLYAHKKVQPKVLSHEDFLRLGEALMSYNQDTEMHAFAHDILSTPFIVKDAFKLMNIASEKLEAVFNRKFLTTRYGHQRVDFYPHNMKEESAHPYFLNFGSALYQLLNKPEEVYVGVDASEPGTYIQWNLDHPHWTGLLKDLGATLPGMLNDSHWTSECFRQQSHYVVNKSTKSAYQTVDHTGDSLGMNDGTTTTASGDETRFVPNSASATDILSQFYLSTHWQMLLIGENQAGMFNHMDTLRTASWQLQLVNAKKWHLCSPEMTPFLYKAGEVDMFHVDYSVHPLVLQARCYEVTLQPGELLYYPADYWHQTLNIGTPSIALSSTLVTPLNYKHIIAELRKECTNNELQRIFLYDPHMCAMLEECYAHWSDIFTPII